MYQPTYLYLLLKVVNFDTQLTLLKEQPKYLREGWKLTSKAA